jgi:hypothetical protein
MQRATVPLARSPLSAEYQHLAPDEFVQTTQAYKRLWVQTGRFPQIAFPIPGPFKRCGPRMYLCTSWPVGRGYCRRELSTSRTCAASRCWSPDGTQIVWFNS